MGIGMRRRKIRWLVMFVTLTMFCTVFLMGLLPLLLSAALTVTLLLRHRELSLLGTAADGVSPLTETVSLYSARLTLNGIVLLLFAAADRAFARNRGQKNGKGS